MFLPSVVLMVTHFLTLRVLSYSACLLSTDPGKTGLTFEIQVLHAGRQPDGFSVSMPANQLASSGRFHLPKPYQL